MDQTVKRTGMIGLGAMGLQFARHMQRKGFDVAGYDINADAVRRAENDGIRHRTSPAEIGKHAEVVVVMVATDAQVESVVEHSGLIDALAPGSVICIASSVAPETCRRLAALAAAKNIGVLDDVRQGYVSPEAAARDYGVVLTGDRSAVDAAATARKRSK